MVVCQQCCTHKEWKRFSHHTWGIEYCILYLIPLLVFVYTRQPNQALGWAQIFDYLNIQIFWVSNKYLYLMYYIIDIWLYLNICLKINFFSSKIKFSFKSIFPKNVSIQVPIFTVFHFGPRISLNICPNLCLKYIWIFISEVFNPLNIFAYSFKEVLVFLFKYLFKPFFKYLLNPHSARPSL